MVAGFGDIPLFAEAAADGGYKGANFVVGKHSINASLLDIDYLTSERQNRLSRTIAPCLSRTACGVTFDKEKFSLRRIALGAVPELARQRKSIHYTLAASRLASGASSFSRTCRQERLFNDGLGNGGIFLKEGHELLGHNRADNAFDFTIAEFCLGLTLELRLRNFNRDDDGKAFAHIVTGKIVFFLQQFVFASVLVDCTRKCRTEA